MLSYNDVYGQLYIKNYLKQIKEKKDISHAYIIEEDSGMGAEKLAFAWAAHLLCESHEAESCQSCHSCRQMAANSHPDFILIEAKNKKSIGIKDIREYVGDTINLLPYYGGYKIYIIKDAQNITVQAQNALLKTIEAPPMYAVIILLCTNTDLLLETIKSRCIKLRLRYETEASIKKGLLLLGAAEAEAEIYASYSGGNMGTAQRLLLDEDFRKLFLENINILENIGRGAGGSLVNALEVLKQRNGDFNEFIEFCRLWYRDALILKKMNKRDRLIFKANYTSLKSLADNLRYSDFYRIFSAFDKAYDRLKANVNIDILMQILLSELKMKL